MTTARKELLAMYPENLVMVTKEFGDPIYIGKLLAGNIQVTPNINEAEKWSELDSTKLGYHKAVTGFNLEFQKA